MRRLLITYYNDRILTILTDEDGRSIWINAEDPSRRSLIGGIYACRVLNVAKNMNAAFVEYEKGKNGYLHLDEKKQPLFLNPMRSDGPVRQGDLLLLQAVRDASGMKVPTFSAVIKTTADIEQLSRRAAAVRCGAVFEEPMFFVTQSLKETNVQEIVTDDLSCFTALKRAFDENCPERSDILRRYFDRSVSFATVYSIDKRVREATERKVYLRSGAFIVIDRTEAMSVIDVNSGKSTAGTNPEAEYLKVNLEAAEEIARQIRLRNLSGMIICDFINMKSEGDNKLLLDTLKDCFSADPMQPAVIDMTALGLVEVTRKKVLRPLYECL